MTRYAVICKKEQKIVGFIHAASYRIAQELANGIHGDNVVVVYDDSLNSNLISAM